MMNRPALLFILFLLIPFKTAEGQLADSTDIYLLTCAPGTESYSIYGHSALRINVRGTGFDMVYNWGIFDFSAPHFVYRFAKGKLDYMLGVYSYQSFLGEYSEEKRSVWSQKLNLDNNEKEKLFALINENLKPENIKYRYDFFFDNCATRVRDIISESASDTVIFPQAGLDETFRQLINPFQQTLPWLDMGADMLLGLQADRKATVSDEMFLPTLMKENLGNSIIVHDGKEESLTGPVETILDIPVTEQASSLFSPVIVMYLVLLLVILVTFVLGIPLLARITDLLLFSAYSLVSLLLVFTNLFSEHDALHYNLLLLGINPLLLVVLACIIVNRRAARINRLALTVSLVWFPAALSVGQGINPAVIPMVLSLMVRMFRHSEFGKTI